MNPLRWSFGRRFTQSFYQRLHRVALAGMNCGMGGDIQTSGEGRLMKGLSTLWKTTDPLVFFDVGANNGDYAKQLAETFAQFPALRIFALEPSPATYTRMESRLQSLIQEGRVVPLPIALGDRAESRNLYSTGSEASSGLTSLYDRRLDHHQITLLPETAVSVRTLDQICDEYAIHRIHFLKMDIEGHELAALKGASSLLKNERLDAIQFEFGGCNIDSRTFWQDFFYLLAPRYRLYRILRDGLRPVPAYRETDEIFTTTNFLAALPSFHAALLRY